MLSAQCPSCGAPAPVSLVTPELMACSSCHYQGPPSPEISAQLRLAVAALWQMDAADRQLTGAQRFNLKSARSYFVFIAVGLGAVLLPLVLLAGGGVLFVVSAGSFEPAPVLLAVTGMLPLVVGAGASALALRHVYRRGVALAERCAAAPPIAEGHPARCHVCGGPLQVQGGQGLARCGFCQADNLVSAKLLSGYGARRQEAVGQLVEQVRGEARALDRGALSAGAAAFGVVLLSPIVGLAVFVAAAVTGTAIETGPISDARYAWVPVANTRCIARVKHESGGDVLEFGLDRPVGTPERMRAPAQLKVVRGADLIGQELGFRASRRGKLKRLYRTALAPSFDRAELQIGTQLESNPLPGMCEVSTRRRTVAHDERLVDVSVVRPSGDQLLIAAGKLLLGVPKAGGAVSLALESKQGAILDFQSKGAALYVLRLADDPGHPRVLERHEGERTERLAEDMYCFALDGDEVLIGKPDGLFRSDGGVFRQIDETREVAHILVDGDFVYFTARSGPVHERVRATGQTRLISNVMAPYDLARIGSYLYVADGRLRASFLPLAGGDQTSIEGRNWSARQVRADGSAVYFELSTSGRGGVASVMPGRKDLTAAKHYGIDTNQPSAFTVDGGEVFWVDEKTISSEPVSPP